MPRSLWEEAREMMRSAVRTEQSGRSPGGVCDGVFIFLPCWVEQRNEPTN